MKKGDIILIPFPFTDLSGIKLRPAVVLATNNYDLIAAFITTQIRWKEPDDVVIKPTKQNGLKQESLIRLEKIATLDVNLVIGILGNLDANSLQLVNQGLIQILKLN